MSFKEAPEKTSLGSPVDKNPPLHQGDMGSICWSELDHTCPEQLSLPSRATEAAGLHYWVSCATMSPRTAMKDPTWSSKDPTGCIRLHKEITTLENSQHFISYQRDEEPSEVRMQWELRGVFWEFTLEIRMWDGTIKENPLTTRQFSWRRDSQVQKQATTSCIYHKHR